MKRRSSQLTRPGGKTLASSDESKRLLDALDAFASQLDGMLGSLPTLLVTLRNESKTLESELLKFRARNQLLITKLTRKKSRSSYALLHKHEVIAFDLGKRVKEVGVAVEVIPRSYLIALVSEFDAYIAKMIKELFRLRPELQKAALSEKTISFEKLSESKSIQELREFMIDREIDILLRGSHTDLMKWLEKIFNLTLTDKLPLWSSFIELTERRNLVVHSEGVVSRQYLSVCKSAKATVSPDVKLGTRMVVTRGYLAGAHLIAYDTSFRITHLLLRKVRKDLGGRADSRLVDNAFDRLIHRHDILTLSIAGFGRNGIVAAKDKDKQRLLTVNQAIAHRRLGDDDKIAPLLASEDWSGCAPRFRLALLILQNDFKAASRVMERLSKRAVTESHYRTWPLFEVFRETPEFRKVYRKKFGVSFVPVIRTDATHGAPRPQRRRNS